ncbi:MAG: M48 family metalloprotease [Proteobacteria bacterium]|nr:M48 family metalloprotease [Pseudomonadota bacterium]
MAKRNLVTTLVALSLLGFLLWIPSCAVNPVSGRPEIMLLSEGDEVKLGGQTDVQVVKEYGIYDDPKLASYLNDLCRRMGKLSHRPNLPYQFKILDTSVVNAFAVPGGYIYFTRGILAGLNSEAELAGVMGHEIGHVTARHSAEQYSRAQLASIGLGLGSIFSDTFRALSDFAQLGVGMFFLKFSRDNERQADDLGVEYASRAGYDASQLAHFFETLERMNPGSDRSGLPGWFSTHPNPENRVQAVRARSVEWRQRLGKGVLEVRREEYLRLVDGLVFGEDPRQGYVEEGLFYHPELRFQFPVPQDWKLNDTPSQVQMVSKEKDAAILFSIASGPSPKEAARGFVDKTKAVVIRSEPIEVNGLASYRLVSEVRTQQGLLRVISYFIQREKRTFIFHGVSSIDRFQGYAGLFERTMGQFKTLSDPKKIDVQPDRIRVQSVETAGTLRDVLLSLKVPEAKLKEIALLNGKGLEERIPAMSLVKVVEKGRHE